MTGFLDVLLAEIEPDSLRCWLDTNDPDLLDQLRTNRHHGRTVP